MIRSIQFTVTTLFAITALMATTITPSVMAKGSLLERGTYLMRSIVACGNCHTPKNMKGMELPGMELAGGFRIVETMFTAVTANITPDRETGIGNWTDKHIINAIRNGSESAALKILERTEPRLLPRSRSEVTGTDGAPIRFEELSDEEVLKRVHSRNRVAVLAANGSTNE